MHFHLPFPEGWPCGRTSASPVNLPRERRRSLTGGLRPCGRDVPAPRPELSPRRYVGSRPSDVTSRDSSERSLEMKGLGGCTAVAGVSGDCGDGSAGHNSEGRQEKGARVGSSRAGFRHCPCLLHSSQADWQRRGRHRWAGRTPSLATPKVTGAEPTFVSFPGGYKRASDSGKKEMLSTPKQGACPGHGEVATVQRDSFQDNMTRPSFSGGKNELGWDGSDRWYRGPAWAGFTLARARHGYMTGVRAQEAKPRSSAFSLATRHICLGSTAVRKCPSLRVTQKLLKNIQRKPLKKAQRCSP